MYNAFGFDEKKTIEVLSDVAYYMSCATQELKEAFQRLVSSISDEIENLGDLAIYVEPTPPREYGMRLMRRKRKERFDDSYRYIRVFQRNLPYQSGRH